MPGPFHEHGQNRRMDRMSNDAADTRAGVGNLAARVGELERVLAYLLAKSIQGEPISLTDAAVRRFLRLPAGAENDPASLARVLSSLEPQGLLECAKCGSKVKDIPGFLDERCPVCGAPVGSPS